MSLTPIAVLDNLGRSLAELESLEDFPELHAAEHVGTDLLGALLDEIKQLHQPWQSMPQHLQTETIDRLDMADNVGQEVLVVIMPAEQFTGGMDGITAEPDQEDLPGIVGDDVLYPEAVTFVRSSQRASISAVQRHLKIGYNRAARLVEEMELQGVVTAMNSNGSREVVL